MRHAYSTRTYNRRRMWATIKPNNVFLPSFLPGRFALTRVCVCARVLRAGTALYELSPRHVVRTARRAPGIYIYIYQRTLAHPQALRRTSQSLELYIFICVYDVKCPKTTCTRCTSVRIT